MFDCSIIDPSAFCDVTKDPDIYLQNASIMLELYLNYADNYSGIITAALM